MNPANYRSAASLLSQALDRRLTSAERARLEDHLTICAACRSCKGHFTALRLAMQSFSGGARVRRTRSTPH